MRANRAIQFQSTLPARGATTRFSKCFASRQFQSTLPARGATRRMVRDGEFTEFQSTLPARGATSIAARNRVKRLFQSTLPARGATIRPHVLNQGVGDFNPRSPHGERPMADAKAMMDAVFQSTLPARGATIAILAECEKRRISIHAPRTGSDRHPHSC